MNQSHGWSGRLACVGTSYSRVGFAGLGSLRLQDGDGDALRSLRDSLGAEELVFLATCNRMECYLLLPAQHDPDPASLLSVVEAFFAGRGAACSGAFLARVGVAAADHLLNVVTGLDSLVVGETEILGQARRAADRCVEAGVCGPTLRSLFRRATACSRRARSETAVGSTAVSVATVAVQKIHAHFGKQGPAVSVIVGVGDMCRKVAQALSMTQGKVIVVNRTLAKAQAFCDRHGGTAMALDRFQESPPAWIDLLFTATAAENTIIHPWHLERALEGRRRSGIDRPLIVCDLGVPRDVDPCLDHRECVRVVSMEHIEALSAKNREALRNEALLAQEIVQDELARLLREERFECLAGVSTRAMLSRQLPHLSGRDQERILSFVSQLAMRMARQPSGWVETGSSRRKARDVA